MRTRRNSTPTTMNAISEACIVDENLYAVMGDKAIDMGFIENQDDWKHLYRTPIWITDGEPAYDPRYFRSYDDYRNIVTYSFLILAEVVVRDSFGSVNQDILSGFKALREHLRKGEYGALLVEEFFGEPTPADELIGLIADQFLLDGLLQNGMWQNPRMGMILRAINYYNDATPIESRAERDFNQFACAVFGSEAPYHYTLIQLDKIAPWRL